MKSSKKLRAADMEPERPSKDQRVMAKAPISEAGDLVAQVQRLADDHARLERENKDLWRRLKGLTQAIRESFPFEDVK